MFKIGIDLGYGEVKGINENGRRVLFPSLVGLGHDRNSDLFGTDAESMDALHVKIGDEDYFVGNLARKESLAGASVTLEANKINLPETRVLMATAAALLLPQGIMPVHLATGLPLEEYESQKAEFHRYLNNFIATVQFLGGPMQGETRTVRFLDVTIIPQGLSAMQLALYDNNKPKFDEVARPGNLFALIDVGFRTTDFAVVEIGQNKRPMLRKELCGTANVGMSSIYRPLQQAFNKMTGRILEERHIPRILEEGKMFFRGKEIDLRDGIRKARAQVAREIRNRVLSAWKSEADLIRRIFLAGGGGEALVDHLADLHPVIDLLDDAQMANARGYLEAARMKEGREAAAKVGEK
ncbi:StbA family protein [Heliobacterium undosum]|uniref:StbA family protein n=1 Tax=Heliomicrobium undosum TaxID=121734 RepID=A0A845LBX7_9FIRM|nr:ParM/StbA family protein [Heliomicrobium undosum]MZP31178.1 StbA family protein [Heliomicrobium undosum]